ncbi:MAG: hypothetical protein Tp172MES00d2C118482111_14 [Prokaryotic dsDNA virus sp.]|nr:MAG: hypothetical protein Tp172MES00d2C118482111_14 [Prokaryotic dsDNA virus sp.]|tara:strand:- start:5092 stop:5364 length:273 start_codon:yes stop_codon:yes gene_type:complete
MEAIILLAVPIVVSILTDLVKAIQSIKFAQNKKVILRFFAATASFVGVVLLNWAEGGDLPLDEIAVYGEALVAFLGSQIPYWLGKFKSKG